MSALGEHEEVIRQLPPLLVPQMEGMAEKVSHVGRGQYCLDTWKILPQILGI